MFDSEAPHSPQDPAAISRKCMQNLLPVFVAICVMCYLDRTNLAFASLSITKDLEFTPETFGLGAGLFYLGYSLCMVPSQLLLLRVGPAAWLGGIVMLWGAVASSFCMLTSTLQFYFMRFLLGAAESGAFPAMWYQLYQFFPLNEVTVPFSILEAAVSTANVLAAPLAALLLTLDGVAGLRGWQWLFIAEGAPTIALGAMTLALIPNNVNSASFLTSSERRWLINKVESSRRGGHVDAVDAFTDRSAIWDAVLCKRVWWVTLMGLLKNVAGSAMLFWCPILIQALLVGGTQGLSPKHLIHPVTTPAEKLEAELDSHVLHHRSLLMGGHGGTLWPEGKDGKTDAHKAVLLSSLPFLAAAGFTLWIGHRSQRVNERALHLAVPYFVAGLLFASLPRAAEISTVLAFIALMIIIACVQGSNSIINSYIPTVAPSPGSVPVALALYNSVANLGGLLGPWLIGEVVQRSPGGYASAMKLMGVFMGVAAAMAWFTRKWQLGYGPGSQGGRGPGSQGGYEEGGEFSKLLDEDIY